MMLHPSRLQTNSVAVQFLTALQTVLACDRHSDSCQNPALHVAQAVQTACAVAVHSCCTHVPLLHFAQPWHSVSAVAPQALDCTTPFAQAVQLVHTLSFSFATAGFSSYCSLEHFVDALQTRSETGVGFLSSYSLSAHAVTLLHVGRSGSLYSLGNTHCLHSRFEVMVGALVCSWVAEHFDTWQRGKK